MAFMLNPALPDFTVTSALSEWERLPEEPVTTTWYVPVGVDPTVPRSSFTICVPFALRVTDVLLRTPVRPFVRLGVIVTDRLTLPAKLFRL